jgi:hypothetical protein
VFVLRAFADSSSWNGVIPRLPHVIMISQPQAVTEVILEAVAAVRSRAVATPA